MISPAERIEIEAAVFRKLIAHLDENREVQNIDMMILANFCRNCLGKWYSAAAAERGIEIEYEQAREAIYGMPYDDWRDKYQTEASAEQKAAFKVSQSDH